MIIQRRFEACLSYDNKILNKNSKNDSFDLDLSDLNKLIEEKFCKEGIIIIIRK